MINSKRIEIILLLKGRAVEEKVLGKKAWNEKPPIKLKVLSLQHDTVCCSQYKSYDFKMELRQIFSRLCQFAKNVKCKRIFQEFISWEPHSSLERERKIRRRLLI